MHISIITPVRANNGDKVRWLLEAIQSVQSQTYTDWDMVVVNDHSEAKFGSNQELVKALQDPRITGLKAEDFDTSGVSGSRNLAARHARGPMLLPLDADDLLPPNALAIYSKNWSNDDGVLYGHTKMVMNDAQRVHQARPYVFGSLLQALLMPVGSLHKKEDWQRVGGWKTQCDMGLEDWEYWIALGEIGVCGRPLNEILYIYRRHPGSRLSDMRVNDTYNKAYANMRSLHEDSYNGRYPMGCCGGGVKTKPRVEASKVSQDNMRVLLSQAADMATRNTTKIRYVGDRRGSWGVNGKISGIHYRVRGPGKLLMTATGVEEVDSRDVPFILALDRGRSFQRES